MERNLKKVLQWYGRKQMRKYKVKLVLRRRVNVWVNAANKQEAISKAQELYDSGDNRMYDEFIMGPTVEVERV